MMLAMRTSVFILISVLISVLTSENSLALTKREAFDRLMAQGPKWRLTQTLSEEAESKLRETRAKTRPIFALGVTQYAARINPVQFGGADEQPIDTIGFGTTALEMRWTLIDPAASFERLSAETQYDISKGQTKQYQTDLTALMLIQFLTVQKLKRQLESIEISANRSQEILKLATKKYGVGAGVPLDVARARSLAEMDRIKKLQLQTKLTKAEDDLALLLGQDALKEELEPLRFNNVAIENMKKYLDRAPELRSDLLNARAGVAAAHKLQIETQSWFFPKLSILGDVGTTRASWLGFPVEHPTGFLGARLEIPLETGGLLDAKRQYAASLNTKAEAQEMQTRLELQNQMKEALEQIAAAQEAAIAAQAYVQSSEEEAKLASQKFSIGGGSVLDVLNAHNNLAAARDTETEAIFAFESAQVALFRTTGSFEGYFK